MIFCKVLKKMVVRRGRHEVFMTAAVTIVVVSPQLDGPELWQFYHKSLNGF